MILYYIAVAIVAAAVGAVVTLIMQRRMADTRAKQIVAEAERQAEDPKRDKVLEGREEALKITSDAEKQASQKMSKLQSVEAKMKQRELQLNQQQSENQRTRNELDGLRRNIEAQQVVVNNRQAQLDEMQRQARDLLEHISGLSSAEAKEKLIESLKDEAKTAAASYINDIMDDAKLTANKEARRIVVQSIQRVATETAIENSVTVFHIDSDEIKGRIIGREGRNIRALEAATGIEIIVDDTPEAIVLSGFDPVRREIARLCLAPACGRRPHTPCTHRGGCGKGAQADRTGNYRDRPAHSYRSRHTRSTSRTHTPCRQDEIPLELRRNLLQHSRETANLCAVMASELGLNPKKARRAGLLHDIGKVPDEEPELPHALLGMKLAEKYKEKPEICNAIGAHHDEVEQTSLLAPIVQVCDAISGARPVPAARL